MRGQILSFDDASGAGLISGDDGIRYTFGREAVSPPASITAGLRVDFVPVAGEATNVMLLAAAPAPGAPSATPGVPVDNYDFAKAMFAFDGRLRRSHFWISWADLFVVGLVADFIPILESSRDRVPDLAPPRDRRETPARHGSYGLARSPFRTPSAWSASSPSSPRSAHRS